MSDHIDRDLARREVERFLLATLLFSAPFYFLYGLAVRAVDLPGEMPGMSPLVVGAFTWTPGIAALATRFALRRTVRGLGWGWGRSGALALAVIPLPFVALLAVYVPVWASSVGGFDAASWSGWARKIVLYAPTLAALVFMSLGEELGWRGLLTPQLLSLTNFARASLVTGLVWAVWHMPLVAIQLEYDRRVVPLWYSLLCFTATTLGLSFFFTWLRLRSGSVWPAVLLHASSNAAQFVFEDVTRPTPLAAYVTFQYGAGFAVLVWALLGLSWKWLRQAQANDSFQSPAGVTSPPRPLPPS
jgi:membrane protease YdiL (CAAX protease family)